MARLGYIVSACAIPFFCITTARAVEIEETFSGLGPFSIVNNAVAPSGDFNNNGTVDAADYVLWRHHLGTSTNLPNDPTPNDVSQSDFDVFTSNFGAMRPRVTGFDADGWLRNGTFQTGLGTFDLEEGTYNIEQHPAAFILNIPALDSDIWQAISGIRRVVAPNGRIEVTTEVENFVPGTAKEQRVMTQLDFGVSLGNPNLLDFLDLQLVYRTDIDSYELVANPLLDGAPPVGGIVKNLRGEGILQPGEHVSAVDWHVVIDSDQVNGGSTILVEYDLNNSGTFAPFFSVPINGLDYTTDLTQATSLSINMLAFGSPGLLPTGSPDPMVTGPALNFDYFLFSTPDDEALRATQAPEPQVLAQIGAVFASAFLFSRCRRDVGNEE